MVVKLSAIKPKGTRLTADKVRKIVKDAYDDVSTDVLRDLVETTASWEHKPTFQRRTTADGGVEVYTDDDIFHYVDQGTKPHIIEPKQAPRLRFQSQYTAKTMPGNILSRPGGASGPFVFAKRVNHPGTEPRLITQTIMRRRGPLLKKRIDDGLRKLV